ANALVAVLWVWLVGRQHIHDDESFFNRAQRRYGDLLGRVMRLRWAVFGVYLVTAGAVIVLIGRHLGADIFPNVDTGMFQLRLRAPAGTRVERTEVIAQKALDVIGAEAGQGNVAITLGYVGTQPASFPVNTIHLWTSGP